MKKTKKPNVPMNKNGILYKEQSENKKELMGIKYIKAEIKQILKDKVIAHKINKKTRI